MQDFLILILVLAQKIPTILVYIKLYLKICIKSASIIEHDGAQTN